MSRSFKIVAVSVFITALLFAFFQWLATPRHVERFELRILQIHSTTNGTVQAVLLLTNGASVSLNVVDDPSGRPFIFFQGTNGMGYGITPLANSLKFYLAPGQCLTNTVTVSNAPSRLRFSCELHDNRAMVRNGIVRLLMSKAAYARLPASQKEQVEFPTPSTEWVEPKSFAEQPSATP